MKYQVILFQDEARGRSYYQSYVISDDTSQGNISCDVLPPYADIQMAQACYYSATDNQWIFDEDEYQEILAEEREKKELDQREQERLALIKTNEELTEQIEMHNIMIEELFDNIIPTLVESIEGTALQAIIYSLSLKLSDDN